MSRNTHVDYSGEEGKCIAFLNERGVSRAMIEILTGRSETTINRTVRFYQADEATIQEEARRKNIRERGYLEATVSYLTARGRKPDEIAELVGKSTASVRAILRRIKGRKQSVEDIPAEPEGTRNKIMEMPLGDAFMLMLEKYGEEISLREVIGIMLDEAMG